MTADTVLDRAHAAMEAAPDNDAARLAFFERLADAELFLLLEAEPVGDVIAPRLFPLEDGPVALVFDREERLAAFAEGPAPYAALSGRGLARDLAGRGIGLGLNLGVAPSAFLVPADAVDWLAATLGTAPEELEARPEELRPPAGLPERLVEGLAVKLASAEGLAMGAFLAGVTYAGGRRGHWLVFIDALPGAEGALAQAVSEALVFSGIDAGVLDVAFLPGSDPVAGRLARVGLRFDIPVPDTAPVAPAPPGSDPARPPRLR
jgi:hypothetical protein